MEEVQRVSKRYKIGNFIFFETRGTLFYKIHIFKTIIDRTPVHPQIPLESATTFVCLPIRHHHTSVTFPSHQRSRVKIINFLKIFKFFEKILDYKTLCKQFFSLINQNIKMICECFYGFYIRIKLPRVTFSFK